MAQSDSSSLVYFAPELTVVKCHMHGTNHTPSRAMAAHLLYVPLRVRFTPSNDHGYHQFRSSFFMIRKLVKTFTLHCYAIAFLQIVKGKPKHSVNGVKAIFRFGKKSTVTLEPKSKLRKCQGLCHHEHPLCSSMATENMSSTTSTTDTGLHWLLLPLWS